MMPPWLSARVAGAPLGSSVAGGLGRRLLVWFLVFSLVPLFVSNAVGYVQSEVLIERLVERYVGALAEAEAQHIQGEIERHRRALRAIAARWDFPRAAVAAGVGSAAAAAAYLRERSAEVPAFDLLYLRRLDGAIVGATGEPGPELSVAAPAGGTALQTIEAAGGRRPRLNILVPIEGEAGVEGHLGGVLGLDDLSRLLDIPEHLAESIETFIVDAAGRPLFISHPDRATAYGVPLRTPVLDGPPGLFVRYTDRQGTPVLATSVAVPDLGWRFLAEVPVSEALGPLRRLRALFIVFGTLFALLLVAAAWLVAGGVAAPVRRLVVATRRVAAGELDVRAGIRQRRDEIGELGIAFDEMTARLAQASERVEELHRREIERAGQLATVGELASGVAHEIRNPLVGVAGGLDLVRRRVRSDPQLDPILEEMTRQVRRIESAIGELLAFARPAEPAPARTDAGHIAARAARLVQPATESSGVEVRVTVATDLPPIEVDEELIRQALVNLLMNAVQATAAGGRVGLSVVRSGAAIEFRVEDTGRGIAPHDLENIFKPFYTTRHAGTGLGLSITKEIVERHGGRLEVESQLGQGSCFTVSLPIAPAAAPA